MSDTELAQAPTAADLPTPGRQKDCKAVDVDGLSTCYRCGLQWEITASVVPACNPMTFRRMHERLLREISATETSLAIITAMKAENFPADPAWARAKLAELEAILRVFVKVTGSTEGRAFLNGKGNS